MAGTKALSSTGARSVTERTDRAKAYAFTSTAATFADARKAQTTSTEGVTDFVTPHITASTNLVSA
jgi:hypothetical protein